MVFEDGLLVNPSMLEYRVPSMLDLPDSMTCIIVENADGPGPYGAKGCGEGSLAGRTGGDRDRGRRRRRAHDRASTDARARLAAHPEAEEGERSGQQ